jgi:hypothetical protein
MRMRPLCAGFGLAGVLVVAVTPADAACPASGRKPVPGTLAAANAGCETKRPPPSPPAAESRRRDEPHVVRSGNTTIEMRGYLQMDIGTRTLGR